MKLIACNINSYHGGCDIFIENIVVSSHHSILNLHFKNEAITLLSLFSA